MATIGHMGAVLTLDESVTVESVLIDSGEEEMPVSGDVLARQLVGLVGSPVSYPVGQLWR